MNIENSIPYNPNLKNRTLEVSSCPIIEGPQKIGNELEFINNNGVKYQTPKIFFVWGLVTRLMFKLIHSNFSISNNSTQRYIDHRKKTSSKITSLFFKIFSHKKNCFLNYVLQLSDPSSPNHRDVPNTCEK